MKKLIKLDLVTNDIDNKAATKYMPMKWKQRNLSYAFIIGILRK